MEATYDDFIGIYKNYFPKEWCQELIQIYESYSSLRDNRQSYFNGTPLEVSDNSLDLEKVMDDPKVSKLLNYFIQKFNNEIYPSFYKKYASFPEIYDITGFKLQKTLPGEGYHIWHTENERYFDEGNSKRFGVYTIYLNNVEEGGETEFLFQHKRVPPTEGTITIFPSPYTHLHRGNTPLSGVKYIITGWLELTSKEEYIKMLTPTTPPNE